MDAQRGDAFFEFLYQNVAEPLATEDVHANELQAGGFGVLWVGSFGELGPGVSCCSKNPTRRYAR